jgi:hypothetical protein
MKRRQQVGEKHSGRKRRGEHPERASVRAAHLFKCASVEFHGNWESAP